MVRHEVNLDEIFKEKIIAEENKTEKNDLYYSEQIVSPNRTIFHKKYLEMLTNIKQRKNTSSNLRCRS